MKRPEILSPAGNFEKMRSAILYGADAVYLAGHVFGMRAAADNFGIEELRSRATMVVRRSSFFIKSTFLLSLGGLGPF